MDPRDQMNVVLYEMRMMMKAHRENFKSNSKEERTRLRKLRKQYEIKIKKIQDEMAKLNTLDDDEKNINVV